MHLACSRVARIVALSLIFNHADVTLARPWRSGFYTHIGEDHASHRKVTPCMSLAQADPQTASASYAASEAPLRRLQAA